MCVKIAKQSISGPGLTMRAALLCIPALCRADSCGPFDFKPFALELNSIAPLITASDRTQTASPKIRDWRAIDGAPMSRMPFLFAVHFRRPGVAQFLAGSVHSGFYFPDLPHLTSNSAFSLFTWTGDVISICSQPL